MQAGSWHFALCCADEMNLSTEFGQLPVNEKPLTIPITNRLSESPTLPPTTRAVPLSAFLFANTDYVYMHTSMHDAQTMLSHTYNALPTNLSHSLSAFPRSLLQHNCMLWTIGRMRNAIWAMAMTKCVMKIAPPADEPAHEAPRLHSSDSLPALHTVYSPSTGWPNVELE